MRAFLLAAICFSATTASAQYYYKDILGGRESVELLKLYKTNRVSKVVISSSDATGKKDEQFYAEQIFSSAGNSLKTVTRASAANTSMLVSYFDANGNILSTVDSSDVVASWTSYRYNDAGQLVEVISTTSDSAKTSHMKEQHIWQWNGKTPVQMLRIKNGRDTVFVSFKTDAAGNVIEEQETHRKVKSFPYFYYYNDNNQLTDIAQYNARVDKVLPSYMFEYSDKGQVVQKITVPSNKGDYLIWRYQYDANGLKTKEAVYDKQKKLTGRIEYQYQF